MAIDGRRIGQQEAPGMDGSTSTGARVAAFLIVAVPVVAVLAFAYWSGTWIGGTLGGISSLVSVAITVLVVWAYRRGHSKR